MKKETAIQIEAPKLHRWQKDFIRTLDKDQRDDIDTQRIYVIKSGRQVGKSFTMSMLLLRQSINYRRSVSWYVAPTLAQCRKVFREMESMLEGVPVLKAVNKSDLIFFFYNGSEIHFGSAEQGDTLRGNTVKYRGLLLIDEAAFQDDLFMSGVLFPYCNVFRRPIILVSSPMFKEGLFYDLYNSKDERIRTFNVMDYDLSFFRSEEQVALYERTYPRQRFISEVLGEFITAHSEVFGDFLKVVIPAKKVIKDTYPKYWIAIDWGSGSEQDSTAIVVMNAYRQVVEVVTFNDLDATQTIEKVAEIVAKYNKRKGALQKVIVEKNSIGKVFLDLLKKRLGNIIITPFVTTNASKNRIINQLQLAIQQENISLLDDRELKYQFSCYQIERTKTGKTTFNARSGAHDDIVMAVAMCYDAVNTKSITFR